jgi:hypothetical protein
MFPGFCLNISFKFSERMLDGGVGSFDQVSSGHAHGIQAGVLGVVCCRK